MVIINVVDLSSLKSIYTQNNWSFNSIETLTFLWLEAILYTVELMRCPRLCIHDILEGGDVYVLF